MPDRIKRAAFIRNLRIDVGASKHDAEILYILFHDMPWILTKSEYEDLNYIFREPYTRECETIYKLIKKVQDTWKNY